MANTVPLFLAGSPLALKELTKALTFLYNFLCYVWKTKMSFISSLAFLGFLFIPYNLISKISLNPYFVSVYAKFIMELQ